MKVWRYTISYPRDLKATETFADAVDIIERLLGDFKLLARLEKAGAIKAGICWDTGWGWDIEVVDEKAEEVLKEYTMLVWAREEEFEEC